MSPVKRQTILPRLLTAEEAASYLGYKSQDILRKIPIKPIRIAIIGPESAPRYDRYQLDAWIDGMSGLSGSVVVVPEIDEAAAALNDWMSSNEARCA